MSQPTAYQLVLELFLKSAAAQTVSVPVRAESVNELMYQVKPTGIFEDVIADDAITIASHNLPDNLSPRAFKLLWRILKELKMNNALWYFDQSHNTRDSTAIKELREAEILLKTENPHIHIVNAFFMRRGSRNAVLATTAAMLGKAGKLDTACIRNLKSVKEMPRLR